MRSASVSPQRTVIIRNKYGLHARPAAEFIRVANQFQSDIFVRKGELEVNGKSIMGVMMLAAEKGSRITIRASGDDAAAAVEELSALIEGGFGEE
ncbi:MAG: HPr family phosphocarrier protein [Gemmatimonadetes bacterium]|nr:HPr family phosphocarrier protein [Gemmatimonadota bacterium]